VFPIALPPLRERRDDIPELVRHLAAKAARKLGLPQAELGAAFVEQARAYDWPGNIRELENLIERSLIMGAAQLPGAGAAPPASGTLEAVERAHIRRVLEQSLWRIEGERGAARILGLNPSTLRARLRKLGIAKPVK
jgi:formate hydrogenlyase transcriptional activator